MPVYQYTCTECGERLEVRQSFTDDALTVCPVCAGRLRKVLSAVGVVFKGSGFYRNDSRADSSAANGAAAKADPVKTGASATEGASSGSPKAESSPAPSKSDGSSTPAPSKAS